MNDLSNAASPWLAPVFLVAIAGCLFFVRLDTALLEPEETRYAEISRQMFEASEWIIPLHHGHVNYDKPPLIYWLVMISYSVFGVDDWAARVVPGICGVLSALVVYFWGKLAFGARSGFLGALVLVLSARFVYIGRFVATDAPFSLCVLCALACTQLALIGPRLRWRWWLAGGVACGVGLLAKGPTVFVLVGVPSAAYLLANHKAVRPARRAYLVYLAGALLVASPWYAAVMMRDSHFAEYFFWKHHVLRYVAPFDHPKPFWFYIPDLLAGTLPWSLLLLPVVRSLWRDRHLWAERRAPECIFPMLAAAWCVAFFSASGCKRVGYVLPAFAPLALAFGVHLDRWLDGVSVAYSPISLVRALPLTAILLGISVAMGLSAFNYWPTMLAIVVAAGMIGLAVGVFRLRHKLTPKASLAICSTIVAAECLVGVQWVLPEYAERFSLRREVRHVSDEMSPSARVVCFPRRPDSVSFYLRRDDTAVFTEKQRDAVIAFVEANAEVWLFLRDDDSSRRLLAAMSSSLQVSEREHHGTTVVVRVRHLDSAMLATRLR